MNRLRLSSEQQLTLMAYVDGELGGSEKEQAAALVASNAEAAHFVREIGTLGALFREGHRAREASREPIDIADAVMGKVAEESKSAKIIPIGTAKPAPSRTRSFQVGGGVLAALALAAAVFVMVKNRPEEMPMAAVAVPSVTGVEPSSVGASGVEVGAIESPGHSVSVFYLPTSNELSTSVVIWVDEKEEN